MQYRKKPVVIDAIQYTGHNGEELRVWSSGAVVDGPHEFAGVTYVQVDTLEGVMIGKVGDYIIRGLKGEFYPCREDIFLASYEPV